MRTSRLWLASMAAAALLGALTTTSSARNLSVSSQVFRVPFREVRFEAAFGNSPCQLTLEGSFHTRTLPKVASSLIGYVTAAKVGPCPVGTVTILQETLPWHAQYVSFSGVLPNIAVLNTNIIGWAVRYRETFGITCLARSTAAAPVRLTYTLGAGGVISGVRIGGVLPTGEECFGASGTYSSDEGRVTVLNGTAAITLRLI
jgi:hypothetical protein